MAAHLRAFGAQWASRQALLDLDALGRHELVVQGELIWRAIFDGSRPAESDRWLGDPQLYRIVGADTVESVDDV